MFRPRLLLTGLAIALGACAPQDPQAVTSATLAEKVILPGYSRWVEADRRLASSALAFCQNRQDLAQARQAFLAAQQAWAELQPLLVGPLAEGNRSWQVQFWPDRRNLVARQVEQLVDSGAALDAAALEKASVVVQGLSAYEYILFDRRLDLADAAQKARYCPLLEAIGEYQKGLAEDILARWQQDDGMLAQLSRFPNPRYADAHEAIGDLLRVQVTALETLKKKLGDPLGRHSKGIAQPYLAEAWRSHASLASIGASLASAQNLWQGADGKGLKTLLDDRHQTLAAQIDAAYAQSRRQLQALFAPLDELLGSAPGRAQLNALYDSLDALQRLYAGELAKALDVQLGFNANDGD